MKGRTRQGRLKAVDDYLLTEERSLIAARSPAPVLDIGFGQEPITTVELFESLRAENPSIEVIGIESDEARATAAAKQEQKGLRLVRGDFALLPLLPKARLIRIMNVLRGLPAQEAPVIHRKLGAALIDGGLAIEGSADPTGDITTAHLLRRKGDKLEREALLFHTTFAHGFAPHLFRDWLPSDVRRRVKPGEWTHDFFAKWTEAWERVRTDNPKASFIASVEAMEGDKALATRGYFRWAPEGGVPA